MGGMTASGASTLAVGVAGILTGWLASNHIIEAADVTNDTAILAAALTLLAGIAVGVWKLLQHTKTAQIAAVNNGDNGVKVVPATAPTPKIDVPLK